ncbi:MAG: hypothetical protein JSU92_12555 [Deltaproteobacteria bacterium]|nr:MAG: hypothetical protein JSU92_12555 [Deltaproteobacteria bacterium]
MAERAYTAPLSGEIRANFSFLFAYLSFSEATLPPFTSQPTLFSRLEECKLLLFQEK